jgi:hypothetical protein
MDLLDLQELSVFDKNYFEVERGRQTVQAGLNLYFKRYDETNVLINYVDASASQEGTRSILLKTLDVSEDNNFSVDLPLPLSDDDEVMQILSGRVNPTAEDKIRVASNIFETGPMQVSGLGCDLTALSRQQHKLGIVFIQNSAPRSSFKVVTAVRQSCFVMTVPAYVRLLEFINGLYKSVEDKMLLDVDVMRKAGQFQIEKNLICVGSCNLENFYCLDSRDEITLWALVTLSGKDLEPKMFLVYEHQKETKRFPLFVKNLQVMSQPERLWKFVADYKDGVNLFPASMNIDDATLPATSTLVNTTTLSALTVDVTPSSKRPKTPLSHYEAISPALQGTTTTRTTTAPNSISLLNTPPLIDLDNLEPSQQQQQQQQQQPQQQVSNQCSEILPTAMKDIFFDDVSNDSNLQQLETSEIFFNSTEAQQQRGRQTQFNYGITQQRQHHQQQQQQQLQQQQQHLNPYYRQGQFRQFYNGYLTPEVASRLCNPPQQHQQGQRPSSAYQQQQTAADKNMTKVGQCQTKRTPNDSRSHSKKVKAVSKPSCYPSDSSRLASTLTAIGKIQAGDVTLSFAAAASATGKTNPKTSGSSRSISPPRKNTASGRNASSRSSSKSDRSNLVEKRKLTFGNDSGDDFYKRAKK